LKIAFSRVIGNHPLPALPTYSITCHSANRTKQLFSSISHSS